MTSRLLSRSLAGQVEDGVCRGRSSCSKMASLVDTMTQFDVSAFRFKIASQLDGNEDEYY
jgi:hypothetical protein